MIELHVRPMERDEDGWIEVVLVAQPVDEADGTFAASEAVSEGETVGHVREVEGTEGSTNEWWDARVGLPNASLSRRFIGVEAAMLALAVRARSPHEARRMVGW